MVDASGALREANAQLVGNPEFSNLPRKFKISLSGCSHRCAQHEINDVGLVGALSQEGEPGFDLWVGGGLSTNPIFASRLGVFVGTENVVPVVLGVTSVFRDWGYRKARNRARLKFLVQDWGPEKFRHMLQNEIGFVLPDLDEAKGVPASAHREHVGIWPQKDGRNYVGFASKAGRISGHQLRALARLANSYGHGRIRTTTQQKMVILDVAPERTEQLVDELDVLDLPARASNWRRGTMACTGIEFCKLAIVETKGRAAEMYQYLDRAVPGYEYDIRINVNGCPNSCARFQVADIGLMGCLVTEKTHNGAEDGGTRKVEAFLVHLGGHLGEARSFGRKVKGVKVLASEAGPYVETLVRRFRAGRAEGESFAAFVNRLSDQELQRFGSKPPAGRMTPPPAALAQPRAS